MGGVRTRQKDKDDTTQITLDWSDWLGTSTISSSVWSADNGVTLANSSNSTTSATTYVSGGAEDSEYWIKNTITTADSVPRIESRSVQVRVVRKLA